MAQRKELSAASSDSEVDVTFAESEDEAQWDEIEEISCPRCGRQKLDNMLWVRCKACNCWWLYSRYCALC